MAEQETAKSRHAEGDQVSKSEQVSKNRKQVLEMNARQPPETIAPLPVPHPGAGLEVDLQGHIGRQLRAVYEEVVREPVPDRFLKLLEELDRKKKSDRGGDRAERENWNNHD
jgi:hypothetical protein